MNPRDRRLRLREIERISCTLRESGAAPDLTSAILERVDSQRPFLDAKQRRLVLITRVATAAAIGVLACGLAISQLCVPPELKPSTQPCVLGDLCDAAQADASASFSTIKRDLVALPIVTRVAVSPGDDRPAAGFAGEDAPCLGYEASFGVDRSLLVATAGDAPSIAPPAPLAHNAELPSRRVVVTWRLSAAGLDEPKRSESRTVYDYTDALVLPAYANSGSGPLWGSDTPSAGARKARKTGGAATFGSTYMQLSPRESALIRASDDALPR